MDGDEHLAEVGSIELQQRIRELPERNRHPSARRVHDDDPAAGALGDADRLDEVAVAGDQQNRVDHAVARQLHQVDRHE